MEIIIEEINRSNKLIGRHKFTTHQVGIGRGYNNDIILSDPHVCANHISLSFEDGCWFVEDLNSLNGSKISNIKDTITKQKLTSGDIISIGKSQLKFILPSHPVASSVKFDIIESIVEQFGRWSVILSMLVLFTALNIIMMYLNSPAKDINYNSLVLWGLTLTLGYAIWPLLCSLMSHLNKHETRIGNQIGVTFVMINLFWLVDFIEAFLGFNLSSDWTIHWFLVALSFAMVYGMFWLNFYIAFQQPKKRRIKVAFGFTVILFASLFLYDLSNQPDFKTYPVYDSTILSPTFAVSTPTSSEKFIANSNDIFDATRKLAKEKED